MTRAESPSLSITRAAAVARRVFDRAADRIGVATVIVLLFVLTGTVAAFLGAILHRSCDSPPNIVLVELAFSVDRFRSLLHGGSPEASCRDNIVESLYWDCAFPLAYAPLLAAVFAWAERWRRRAAPARSLLRDALLVSPFIAGALDLVENAGLAVAAATLPLPPSAAYPIAAHFAVAIGSVASAVKWLLLAFNLIGIIAEVFAARRGA